MKIFISWSGTLSQEVAELLKSWLENIFQGAEAWMSKDDITKGEIWFSSINETIAQTDFGILCLTRENMNAPWILFEAGALSKGLSKSRVCPLLIDFDVSQLTQPLAQFNASRSSRAEMFKLVEAINQHSGEKLLAPERLRKTFDKWWDDFAMDLANINKKQRNHVEAPKRGSDDMVIEILEIVRALQQRSQQSPPTDLLSGQHSPLVGSKFGYIGQDDLIKLEGPLLLDPSAGTGVKVFDLSKWQSAGGLKFFKEAQDLISKRREQSEKTQLPIEKKESSPEPKKKKSDDK